MWVIAVGDPLDKAASCPLTCDFVKHTIPSVWWMSWWLCHANCVVFGDTIFFFFLTQMIEAQLSKKSAPLKDK